MEIDSRIAAMFPGLRTESGVIVVAKAADPNVDTSLTAGDIIHSINGAAVQSMAELRANLEQLPPNSPVVLQVERENRLMFLTFQLN